MLIHHYLSRGGKGAKLQTCINVNEKMSVNITDYMSVITGVICAMTDENQNYFYSNSYLGTACGTGVYWQTFMFLTLSYVYLLDDMPM